MRKELRTQIMCRLRHAEEIHNLEIDLDGIRSSDISYKQMLDSLSYYYKEDM